MRNADGSLLEGEAKTRFTGAQLVFQALVCCNVG
jgi:hypothetical protein